MKFIKPFLILLAAMAVGFMLVAFALWQIDPSKWSLTSRFTSILIAAISLTIYWAHSPSGIALSTELNSRHQQLDEEIEMLKRIKNLKKIK